MCRIFWAITTLFLFWNLQKISNYFQLQLRQTVLAKRSSVTVLASDTGIIIGLLDVCTANDNIKCYFFMVICLCAQGWGTKGQKPTLLQCIEIKTGKIIVLLSNRKWPGIRQLVTLGVVNPNKQGSSWILFLLTEFQMPFETVTLKKSSEDKDQLGAVLLVQQQRWLAQTNFNSSHFHFPTISFVLITTISHLVETAMENLLNFAPFKCDCLKISFVVTVVECQGFSSICKWRRSCLLLLHSSKHLISGKKILPCIDCDALWVFWKKHFYLHARLLCGVQFLQANYNTKKSVKMVPQMKEEHFTLLLTFSNHCRFARWMNLHVLNLLFLNDSFLLKMHDLPPEVARCGHSLATLNLIHFFFCKTWTSLFTFGFLLPEEQIGQSPPVEGTEHVITTHNYRVLLQSWSTPV